jgi:hypothetical protein
MGDQSIARPLPTQDNINTQNHFRASSKIRIHDYSVTYMPSVNRLILKRDFLHNKNPENIISILLPAQECRSMCFDHRNEVTIKIMLITI